MATQGLPLVLRIPRAEEGASPEYVLIHVSSNGSHPLDLKLVGSESSEVFAYSLKQTKTSTLKAKNSSTSQTQWEDTLSTILLDGKWEDGLEAVAEVVEGESLTLTIQKRIEGITSRLGQIVLPTDDEEIDFFAWCGLAISAKQSLQSTLITHQSTIASKDEDIKKLESTLEDLTKLKNSNESALLEKFSLLLNEKKLKIRDQQRLLSSSNVDSAQIERLQLETDEAAPGPSRPKKRKAKGKVVEESSDSEEGGVEKMDVDEPEVQVAEDSDKADEQTASDTETASEDDDDEEPVPPPSKKGKQKEKAVSPPSKGKGKAQTNGGSSRRTRAQTAEAEDESEEIVIPPKRELPFSTKKQPPKGQVKSKEKTPEPSGTAGPAGSETESDDEL